MPSSPEVSTLPTPTEQIYRTVLTAMSDAVLMTDDAGHFTFICPNVHYLFGYHPQEVAALGTIDRLLPLPAETLAPLATGQAVYNLEWQVCDREGGGHWVLINIQPVQIQQGTRLYSCRDITDLRQVEQALGSSEERYGLLLQQSRDFIFIHPLGHPDRPIPYFSEVNQAAIQRLGYTAAEFCQLTPLDITPPEDHAGIPAEAQQLFEQRELLFEKILLAKNGDRIPVEISAQVFDLNGAPTVLAIARDMSDRKRLEADQRATEAALRASQKRLNLLIQQSPLGIIEWDNDFRVVSWNPAAEAIFGYTAAAAQGMHGLDLVPAASRDQVAHLWQQIPHQADARNNIHPNLTAQGHIITCRWHDAPIIDEAEQQLGVAAFVEDITAWQVAESALRESEARFRGAFEHLGVGMCIGYLDGRFLRVNQRFCDITGYSADALLTMTFVDITHPEDLAADIAQVQQLLAGAINGYSLEKRYIRPDGTLVWVMLTVSLLRTQDNELQQLMGAIEDITARKRAEAALQTLNQELEARVAQRTAALEEREQRYRALMDGASDAIFLADIEGNVIEANRQASELLGYSQAELTQMHFTQLHPDSELARVQTAFHGFAHQGKGQLLDTYVQHRNGAQIPVDITTSVIAAKAGPIVQGIFRDVTERKLANQALWESRAMLRRVLDTVPQRIFWQDREGVLLGCNPVFAEDFGLSAEQVVGHTLQDLGLPLAIQPQPLHRPWGSTDTGDLAARHQLITLEREDGTWRRLEVHQVPMFDTDGNHIGYLGTYEDITRRARAEEALRRSEERFRVALQNSPITVFHQDLDLRYTWMYNPALGYAVDAVVGKRDGDLFLPEDAQRLETLKRKVLASGETLQEEVMVGLEDGDFKCYVLTVAPLGDRDGTLEGVTCAALDITDRKRTELALADSQQLVARIADASPDVIYIFDLQAQCNVYVNQQITKHLGFSPEAINAMGDRLFANLLHPDDRATVAQHWQALTHTSDAEVLEVEYRLQDANGGWHWLNSRDTVFTRDDQGRPVQVLGAASEVTRRKEMEAQLRQTNAELARATRLKDEFLANMSHELRTPLNAVLGMTESLQEEIFGPILPRQHHALATIHRSGSHLLSLINDILDLSKVAAGKVDLQRVPVRPAHLCTSSLAFVKQQAHKKGIQLASTLPSHLPDLVVDETRIRQVLINLLNNAVKFTPEGGCVRLQVALHPPAEDSDRQGAAMAAPAAACVGDQDREQMGEQDDAIAPAAPEPAAPEPAALDSAAPEPAAPNPLAGELPPDPPPGRSPAAVRQGADRDDSRWYLSFAIIDTGIGITAADAQRLFQPFVQVDSSLNRRHTGTGLGLSLVRRLVMAHGGYVTLHSQPDQGSCFTVHLPCETPPLSSPLPAAANAANTANAPNAAAAAPITPAQLLLVEDNEANATTLSSYLEARGYHVQVAENGKLAIEMAVAAPPDLIVMDIQMPEMDGLEAIRHLRNHPPLAQVPILALTALAMAGDRDACIAAGANEYMTKPVRLRPLTEMIQQLLGQGG
ncbi:MAG: PAS domain S-box protein [Cyanobacteria bacterium]|nr:PAS domain S-box protein [Cyanobacteriota bacterium]